MAGGHAHQDHVLQTLGVERPLQELRELAQERQLLDARLLIGDVLGQHQRLAGVGFRRRFDARD